MTYEVHFTKTAQAKIVRLGLDPADIEDKMRDHLEEITAQASSEDEEFEIQDLMFSVVETDGKDLNESDQLWVVTGNGLDGVVVDSGRMVQVAAPTTGNFAPGQPFHGKKLMMPMADEATSETFTVQ